MDAALRNLENLFEIGSDRTDRVTAEAALASGKPSAFTLPAGFRRALVIEPERDDYLLWQLCRQVCIWLSQALRHGVLNVVGQTRLHDAFWVEQLAKQASELSASRYLPIVSVLASALDRADRKNTTTAAAEAILIAISPRLVRSTLFDFKRGGKVGISSDTDHQKPNVGPLRSPSGCQPGTR